MWNRQSPAFITLRLMKIAAVGAASASAAVAIMTAAAGGEKMVSAAVGYGALLAIVTAVVLLAWSRDTWQIGSCFGRRSGVISLREYTLRRECVTALEVRRSPLFALFGAVRLTVHTAADDKTNGRELIVNRQDGHRLAARLMPTGKGYVRRYSATVREIMLMSLSQANFFSGLLLVVPLISWTAKTIDSQISERLYSILEETGQLFLPEVSPLLRVLALLPVIGWLLHVAYNLITFSRFKYARSGGSVIIGRGMLIRKTVSFPLSAVTALEQRQTLLTGFFHREQCSVIVSGCGKCVLLPAVKKREMMIETAALFPHGEGGAVIKTVKSAYWWRWWAVGDLAVLLSTVMLGKNLGTLAFACGVPVSLLLLWRAAVGAAAGKKAEVRAFADSVELTGIRGLSIVRLRVMRGEISEVRLRQNPLQRMNGICDMCIRPQGAKRGIWCRHLPLERCRPLLGRLG